MLMRKLVMVFFVIFTPASSAFAAGCGIEPAQPTAPAGCRAMEPTCVCDAKGNCHWEFICVRQ
jgi:hypothetical protein